MIEVELRSLITEEKFSYLLDFFKKEAKYLGEDYQETYYFDSPQDLRIQKNNNFSKIWLKKGNMHDEQREEIEIKFKKEDFPNLENLFLTLGYKVNIKWFRTRHTFLWDDISVMLDYTKGYEYIIELEILSDEIDKEKSLKKLKEKMSELNISITPKEEFNKKYTYYKNNWKELTNSS